MIDMKIKSMFFDRKKVIDAVDRATRKVLSKFGAFVRTAARSSLRKRKASSPAGSPPSSHVGLLKKFIFFGYDATTKSVVIGPALIGAKGKASGTIPEVLEHGGASVVVIGGVPRHVSIDARPYMGPALARELPKLPAIWANSVKG